MTEAGGRSARLSSRQACRLAEPSPGAVALEVWPSGGRSARLAEAAAVAATSPRGPARLSRAAVSFGQTSCAVNGQPSTKPQ